MSLRNIQPLSNHVFIKRADAALSRGGIFLPESAKEKPKEGEVLAVGPGKLDKEGKIVPMDVKVGDKVLFTTYGGSEIETSDEGEYLIVSEDDVLAVLD